MILIIFLEVFVEIRNSKFGIQPDLEFRISNFETLLSPHSLISSEDLIQHPETAHSLYKSPTSQQWKVY